MGVSIGKKYCKSCEKLASKKKAVVGSSCDNKPYLKVMIVAKREGVKTFYFASNNSSMRVKQWLDNPNACIYFYGGIPYKGVMFEGKMEVINDKETKREIWSPMMKSVYKGGETDPDYCVLKFTADFGRYYCNLKSETFEV